MPPVVVDAQQAAFLKSTIENTPARPILNKPSSVSSAINIVHNQDADRNLNQSPLENVISQVIEWTLASNKLNANSPQVIQSPIAQIQETVPTNPSPHHSNAHTGPQMLTIQSVTSLNSQYQPQTSQQNFAVPVAQTHHVATTSSAFVNSQTNMCVNSAIQSNQMQVISTPPTQVVRDDLVKSFNSFNPMNNQYARQKTPSNFSNVVNSQTQISPASAHGYLSNQFNFPVIAANNLNQNLNVQPMMSMPKNIVGPDNCFNRFSYQKQRLVTPTSFANAPGTQTQNAVTSPQGFAGQPSGFSFNGLSTQQQRQTSPAPRAGISNQRGFPFRDPNQPSGTQNATPDNAAAMDAHIWRTHAQEAL